MVAMSKEVKERYWKKKQDSSLEINCACGCGKKLKSIDKYGRPVKFLSGHNNKKYEGEDSTKWAAQKRYRSNNFEKLKEYKKEYYRSKKLKAMELLGNKCKKCGIEYNGLNAPIFEFHHLDPHQKENSVTRMLINKAWSKTLYELKKCILICANCHNHTHGGNW